MVSTRFPALFLPLCAETFGESSSNQGGPPFNGRYPNAAISLPRGVARRTMGFERGYLECCLCGTSVVGELVLPGFSPLLIIPFPVI